MTGQWPPQQQPGQPDPWPGTPQYPAGPPPYPGQPQGQDPGQYPMPPVQQEKRPVPADVVTAFQLWFVVVALGVAYLAAALIVVVRDSALRADFVDQFLAEADKQGEAFTHDQAEQLFVIGMLGFGIVVGLLFTALAVLFIFKMRKGKNWARMLLTMAGVFTVFSALPTVFGAGLGSGTAALLMGGAGILQAVAAIGAIVLMHRKESNAYFLNLPAAPPGR